MTPSTGGTGNVADILHPDDSECSHPRHEQSALLGAGSGQVHSPLSEDEEDEDHAREVLSWKNLPWWKRPSPYLLVCGTFFSAMGYAALLAPKVALYTALACRVHRPEYVANNNSVHSFSSAHNIASVNSAGVPIAYVFDIGETTALFPNYTHTLWFGSTSNAPNPHQKCASDPVVQAIVARLNAVFTTSMGILSCFTAGWWGSLSDRYGRRIVLFVSIFGLFVTEFTHIITAWFMDVLPGGYWFPLVGFSIEGLFGSMASGVATIHAYLADTTDASTRSRRFSLLLGLMFTGIAVGPALGGLLIRSTGTILSVFYFATLLHGIYATFVLFILPESLTRARARGARLRRRQQKADQMSSTRALDVLKNITSLFTPLAVLLPERSLDANPLKRKSRDWNLLFLAIAYALITSAIGAMSYKLQYIAAWFNWTPEITSYYVSLLGATRAIFLAILLPLIIKYFKSAPIQLPSTPDEPLRGTIGPSQARSDNTPGQHSTYRSPVFDLALARISAGLEVIAFLGMAIAGSGTFFALASTINSFAAGFSPAVQALALEIYTAHPQNRGEIGKLFGALSVLQALGAQIISPALYGFVYSNTVTVFPQAILVISMCASLLALVFLTFVRIPSKPAGDRVVSRGANEQGNQETATSDTLFMAENDVA